MTTAETTCQGCGRSFTPHPRGKGLYCSRPCWRAHESASKLTLPCQCCGKPFFTKPCLVAVGKGKYCGKRCESVSHQTRPLSERFWEKVEKGDGCWLWTGARCKRGYGRICRGPGTPYPLLATRVSYELNVGPIPEGLGVLHRCDNPPCVRPDHLFVGTALDNSRDCLNKGRTARGERITSAVLTSAKAAEIRGRYAAGETNKSRLAREYGVGPATVNDLIAGRTWTHVN